MSDFSEEKIFNLLKKDIEKKDLSNLIQARFIKEDVLIYELIEELTGKSLLTSSNLLFLMSSLSDDEFLNSIVKVSSLDGLESIFSKLRGIKDDFKKIGCLNQLESVELYILLTLSLDDISLRDEYMANVSSEHLEQYITSLRGEEIVLRALPYIHKNNIETYYGLKNKVCRWEYSNQENEAINNDKRKVQYTDYENEVLLSITNISKGKIKLDLIKLNDYISDLGLNVIKNTSDEQTRSFLIDNLYDIKEKEIYLPKYRKDFKVPSYKSILPPELTFGVEIECFGDNARGILYYKDKLVGYDVKSEPALPDGLEFSSPILSWNYKDLNSIYQVCNFAKVNSLRCNGRSGGHIHFSSDYLNSIYAWFWFFYLYTKFESILYKISNEAGEKPRANIFSIARPFSLDFINNINKIENIHDKDDLILGVQNLFETKFIGVNLKNIFYKSNTIEFRIPNGSVEADEIIKRILLYGNILKLSRRLACLPLDRKLYEQLHKLDNTHEEETILNIMLDMLFESEEEKDIFKERYYYNKDFNKDIEHNFKTFSFKKRGINI